MPKMPRWMEGIEPDWRIVEAIRGPEQATELREAWDRDHAVPEQAVPPTTCATCRWSVPHMMGSQENPIPTLQCRRYPPQLMSDQDGDPRQCWPCMDANDYCGEYEART